MNRAEPGPVSGEKGAALSPALRAPHKAYTRIARMSGAWQAPRADDISSGRAMLSGRARGVRTMVDGKRADSSRGPPFSLPTVNDTGDPLTVRALVYSGGRRQEFPSTGCLPCSTKARRPRDRISPKVLLPCFISSLVSPIPAALEESWRQRRGNRVRLSPPSRSPVGDHSFPQLP